MKSTINLKTTSITFVHSEETCALDTGEFCQFVKTRHFGFNHRCALFDEALFKKSQEPFKGFVFRCIRCKEEFGR